jgi:hypothetical protein
MVSLDAGGVRDLIEAAIAAASILGGFMAYRSGLAAAGAVAEGSSPDLLAQSINEGIAVGFEWGSPAAAIALIINLWT